MCTISRQHPALGIYRYTRPKDQEAYSPSSPRSNIHRRSSSRNHCLREHVSVEQRLRFERHESLLSPRHGGGYPKHTTRSPCLGTRNMLGWRLQRRRNSKSGKPTKRHTPRGYNSSWASKTNIQNASKKNNERNNPSRNVRESNRKIQG